MKRGIKFLMPIDCGMDIDLIERVEFVFVQGNVRREVVFPSDETMKIDDRTVGVIWTKEQTLAFETVKVVSMDTRITLKDSEFQPETSIERFFINDTLFEEVN